MGKHVGTLRRGEKTGNEMVNTRDNVHFRIGLLMFIVFVFAISSLVVINISNLLQ